jgi:hypothetical protein
VDDGELLVYPSNLWLPGGFTMLQLSSRWPLFDLWSWWSSGQCDFWVLLLRIWHVWNWLLEVLVSQCSWRFCVIGLNLLLFGSNYHWLYYVILISYC